MQSSAEKIDCVIIGAGVVGLAVARRLAMEGRDVIVVEAGDGIGMETSSRNSEVIHAGLYYPEGSLKARLCTAGRDALYTYCRDQGVGHRRIGKLIVATDAAQIGWLDALAERARANGVNDLERLDAPAARKLEPDLRCVAALHSPSTGIVDSHGLMLSLRGDAERHGAVIAFRSPVSGGRCLDDGFRLAIGGAAPCTVECRMLVNAAGLHAQTVAETLDGFPKSRIPPRYYAKGSYFTLSGKSPFGRLIYPAPEPGGLGIHLTLDLAGQARFGPDVQWIDAIDHTVDPDAAPRFAEAIRRYWPGLSEDRLQPGYAGIRPKIVPRGSPDADFMIQGSRDHGIGGLINLFGIESPGLTASLAIADHVAASLLKAGRTVPVPA